LAAGARIWRGAALDDEYDWCPALTGCETVIHTAARVHVMRDTSRDPLAEYRRVNVGGSLRLAEQAAEMGIRRFIYISSIKVNGENTPLSRPFRADDPPAPADPYAVSKCEAEAALFALASQSGMDVVVIRPVLVYGPGVKGNFLALMRLVARGLPLPLGAIRNRRSLVGLRNLVDLIVTCVRHPEAANHTLLVSDGVDLSTTELARRIAEALGRRPLLIPVPAPVLELAATSIGKGDAARRLLGSLQVDIGKTRQLVGWSPPVTVDAGLRETAQWFLGARAAC
jgi:UDP-glucose 4-epimerase